MARNQTIYSELTVLKAMTGIHLESEPAYALYWSRYQEEHIKRNETAKGRKTEKTLTLAGEAIRLFFEGKGLTLNSSNVRWTGNEKEMSASANDISVCLYGTHEFKISVKEKSDVMKNSSPGKLFEHSLKGRVYGSEKHPNWFGEVAPVEQEELFSAINEAAELGLNSSKDLYALKKEDRKKVLAPLEKNVAVKEAYVKMCKRVTEATCERFNKEAEEFGVSKDSIHETVFFDLMRMEHNDCIVCGLEKSGSKPLAVVFPSISEWKRDYKIAEMVLVPGNHAQPVVYLKFKVLNKESKSIHEVVFRIEIRWSHGKFCGNPEAKVYRTFMFAELPWVKNLNRINKN